MLNHLSLGDKNEIHRSSTDKMKGEAVSSRITANQLKEK